ncbi:MAG TPA: DUF445 domain-containing protein [Nevskiaceae bacterium]|nr:DUF445 domain-containing protein [Nevskiaceae bacterium]
MMSWSEIGHDLSQHWYLYASMPLVAGTIGYVTKLVAIRMMFEPIEFTGCRPLLGWQGIVPRNAERMAGIACDTMTSQLIKPADIFGRLDPLRVAQELEQPMLAAVEEITREVAAEYQPGLWEAMPEMLRRRLVQRIQDDAPNLAAQIMLDIKINLDQVFDLRDMVVTNLTRDKKLLNRIFQEAGDKEFTFIARSGIWFGGIIGCVQAVVWALTHSALVMPVFGLFTGWFTDWLALRMVFRPQEPTRYVFGLVEWQGLFLKRRKEVAAAYGALIASEILTPRNIINAVLSGPLSDRLVSLVSKHVQNAVDQQAGLARPLVVLAVGSKRYQEMKKVIAAKLVTRMPEALQKLENYAEAAMDVRNTLITKMQQLDAAQFERLLRPAFEQDEWILIAVGAALGFLVGELQVFLMLHL